MRNSNRYNFSRSQSQTAELLLATLNIVADKQINPVLLCAQVVQVVPVQDMMIHSADKKEHM
jgi:hypothetical protein